MRTVFPFRNTNIKEIGLVLSSLVMTVLAGFSFLIFKKPLSPLFVLGAVLAGVLGAAFVRDPLWALGTAIFVALLPGQILSYINIPFIRQYPILFFMLLACVCWLFSVLSRHRKIIWTSSLSLMLTFLLWGLVTLLWAPNPVLGRQAIMAYMIGFVPLLLIINNINSIQTINRLMNFVALSGWVLMLVGMETILTKGITSGTRLSVIGMNENELGIVALVTMIGVLWQVLQPTTRYMGMKKLLSLMFILMTIVLVAASGSRGSAISLIVTLVAFCFWNPTRKWGLYGLLLLAFGGILVPFLFTTTLDRFLITRGDTLLGGREVLWQATWNLILDRMWQGVGIGNARQELIGYLLHVPGIAGAVKAPTHNPVLQIWAETGLPGIILYMGVPVSAVWLFTREYFHCRERDFHGLLPYFALVSSTFAGYMASWIKGGGMEASITYFLMLSLLLIPACLDSKNQVVSTEPPVMNLGDTL